MCAALSEEAVELAGLLRALQDDFTAICPDTLPDQVMMSAQALDRVCQTLDDFGAIFGQLAGVEPGGLPPEAVAAAIGSARQDHLRRRLIHGLPPISDDAPLEFF